MDGSASQGKPPATLLVVDDDPELLELTEEYLSSQGFEVLVAEDGVAMDAALQTNEVDLMILDLMLPGEDGLSIARRMRRDRDLPIIIVSAQGDDVDRIVGLEIGADDYLAKPFNPRELLARVRAVLRRGARREAQTITFGDFELNLSAHRLTRDGRTVALTSGEFELLDVLVRHPNT
ncbi:MAG: response regulator, partial [Gammaproteobacteria bacterium]|nr:response regulator [Gammaproteobacteria bacterium]